MANAKKSAPKKSAAPKKAAPKKSAPKKSAPRTRKPAAPKAVEAAAATSAPAPIANPATPAHYAEIGRQLRAFQGNVHDVAKAVLGRKLADDEFDLIEKHGDAFKCIECDRWKSAARKSKCASDTCADCDHD